MEYALYNYYKLLLLFLSYTMYMFLLIGLPVLANQKIKWFIFIFYYSPFFGEDVHFEVPRDFRSLCFYLYDTDLIGKDTVLGKV